MKVIRASMLLLAASIGLLVGGGATGNEVTTDTVVVTQSTLQPAARVVDTTFVTSVFAIAPAPRTLAVESFTPTTAVSIRPSGEVAPFVQPQIKIGIITLTYLLVVWTAVFNLCDSSHIAAGTSSSWKCFLVAAFAIGYTLLGFFLGHLKRDADFVAHLEGMHTHHYPAIEGQSILQQLDAQYVGQELHAVECKIPGAPDCIDVYYSNKVVEGIGKQHRLRSQFKGRKPDETSIATETADVTTEDGQIIHSVYTFVAEDPDADEALGHDDGFPQHVVDAIANDPNFANPGAVCLNIVDNEIGKIASIGWVEANSVLPGANEEQETVWFLQCREVAAKGLK